MVRSKKLKEREQTRVGGVVKPVICSRGYVGNCVYPWSKVTLANRPDGKCRGKSVKYVGAKDQVTLSKNPPTAASAY